MKENVSFSVINNYYLIEKLIDSNSKVCFPLNENPNEQPLSDNSINTIFETEDTMDFWVEFEFPKLTISNSLSDNYKELVKLQFQIDIVSPPPQA